jgi:hypothetical protein
MKAEEIKETNGGSKRNIKEKLRKNQDRKDKSKKIKKLSEIKIKEKFFLFSNRMYCGNDLNYPALCSTVQKLYGMKGWH